MWSYNIFYSQKQPNQQTADVKQVESKTPPVTTPTAPTPAAETPLTDTKPSLSVDVKEKLESKDDKVSLKIIVNKVVNVYIDS